MIEDYLTVTLSSKEFDGTVTFQFNLDGVCRKFNNQADLDQGQLAWLSSHFPLTRPKIEDMIHRATNLKAHTKIKELDFDLFWNLFDNKLDKIEAQNYWAKLSKSDQYLAIRNIEPYNSYLERKGISKMYAKKWLNPKYRRFANDYRNAA